MTIFSDEESPTSEQIMEKEDQMEKKLGKPVDIIVLNPKEIKMSKTIWNVSVHPKEKKSSELSKILFEAMVGSAMNIGLIPNQERLEREFIETWELDPKFFEKEEGQQVVPEVEAKGLTPPIKPPQINIKAEGNKLI